LSTDICATLNIGVKKLKLTAGFEELVAKERKCFLGGSFDFSLEKDLFRPSLVL
jgi:hypothetical protein